MASYTVALTGASGAIYGIRLTDELLRRGDDVDIIISPSGFLLLKEELSIDCAGMGPAGIARSIKGFISKRRRALKQKTAGRKAVKEGSLRYIPSDDLTAAVASGSSLRRAMVVCPCSMGTLGRIASGVSGNLIERAADCVLKERGALVLVPRETPLNSIHLENMLKLSMAGAVILPAMPGFYSHPSTVDDMVDFVVGKTLDVLGVGNDIYRRWK